jgi:hypothetical protein
MIVVIRLCYLGEQACIEKRSMQRCVGHTCHSLVGILRGIIGGMESEMAVSYTIGGQLTQRTIINCLHLPYTFTKFMFLKLTL